MKDITTEELKKKIANKEDFILLDVRTPEENKENKITNSVLIPVDELEHRYTELDKNKEIVIYCRSGNRSVIAAMMLEQLGFKKVTNMLGGILEW